ncbi:hypothetical protein [Streptomyces sp. NPDC056468]|uniref:hypothetical protein n=1 Tax=Streptomyces sp. NPDC056468 TaxID=3345830 RepID=UPI0036C33607
MTLGTDIEVHAGDLVFDGRDLVLVTGLDALAQSLRNRVLTPLGSDRYDTRYGLDVRALFTGPLASAGAARDVLRLNLVRAVGTDPRVREVSDVLVRPAAEAGRRDAWAAEVRLVTVDGTATALDVEVGP